MEKEKINYEKAWKAKQKMDMFKRVTKRKELKEFKRALYNIDMVQGFVNFGPMANPLYNNLVPEQLKIMEDFRKENESINFIAEGHNKDALEFKSFPEHCILGTPQADIIPDFGYYTNLANTRTYRKNSINGMLNDQVRKDIKSMTNLKETVFMGVCEDLCVMDFVRTYARYLDELNRKVNLFVVANTVDTFDAPNHNREEWKTIARKVMEQAGVIYVENYNELKETEKTLGLRK